jgi:membrane-bound ClpP family serine protease
MRDNHPDQVVLMIILGIILIIIGWLLPIPWLATIGAVLLVVGIALWLLGASEHAVGGRSHWY